jgi:hypothetical protein
MSDRGGGLTSSLRLPLFQELDYVFGADAHSRLEFSLLLADDQRCHPDQESRGWARPF